MNIRVYKIRPSAKLPLRAHNTDAGMDLFYCPDDVENQGIPCAVLQDGTYTLSPGGTCLVPTGIKVEIPAGHMLEIKNKSGIALKQQLLVGACVVAPGQKVAQAVLIPIVTCGVEEVREDVLNDRSDRQSGGFGSTGLM